MLTDRNSQYYGFPEGSIEFFYLVRTVAPKPGSDRHINRCFSVLLLLTFSKAAEWHLSVLHLKNKKYKSKKSWFVTSECYTPSHAVQAAAFCGSSLAEGNGRYTF